MGGIITRVQTQDGPRWSWKVSKDRHGYHLLLWVAVRLCNRYSSTGNPVTIMVDQNNIDPETLVALENEVDGYYRFLPIEGGAEIIPIGRKACHQ